MDGRLYCKVLLVAAASALGALSPAATQTAPTVTVDAGIIRGVASNDVAAFKGIPYAAPPVGALRWRAPQPVAAWRDVSQAAEYGSDCVQKPTPGAAAASGGKFDEDWVFLNVWRPAAFKPGDRLPVLVWIHGGGFIAGGASAPTFNGSALAGQGLVVVSLNYRLGRLGFFMHPALTAAGEEAPGNYGFLDQLAALQWVQRNIAQFGGDAKQVTIAGESAGGVSVIHHLAWPAARGLFHRAVVMSGGGRTYGIGASRARAEQVGVAFAQSVGITGSGADALAALRALPAQKVSNDLGVEALLGKVDTYAGGPIVDGKIVTGMNMPSEVLRNRTAAQVPVLIGTTSDDLPMLFPSRDDPLSFFGADAPVAEALYFAGAADPGAAIKNIAVDITMHEPARFVAKQATAAGQPAWLYRFGYVAESLRPKGTAEHAKEVPYLFGTLAATYGAAATAKDRAMANQFMGYIAEFAKTGDPNRSGLPRWPRYDPAKSELMLFAPDATAAVQPDPWKSRLDLIERAVERRAEPPQ